MHISNTKNVEFSNAYGILCAAIKDDGGRQGLYPSFCRIPSGQKTKPHAHFESELFYIVSGSGWIEVEHEKAEVRTGDLTRIPPFSRHELTNTGEQELVFLSVYSEDFEIPRLPISTVVTAAPPTPNGPLHIGHISGPYLASDIAARYLRLRSSQVRSHSGTDDHQNYVFEKAHTLGLEAEVFRKQMRSRIQLGLQKMQINFDEFIEPKTDIEYENKIQAFAMRAVDSGVITKENIDFPYCKKCDHALVDALIEANCPSCEEPSRGGCESCGVVAPPQDLLHAKCARCGEIADRKLTSVYTFSLSSYLPLIREELFQLNLPVRLQMLIARVTAMKDLKVLLTHPERTKQGLRLAGTDHALHVWFEMAAHYEDFSLSPEKWIHFFGFDNSFHYLLFIPALLRALNPKAKLPDAVITNEFLLLDGQKFSTSRGHAIWADEFVGNTDHLRLYLSQQRPSNFQADFTLENFRSFSLELEGQMQRLIARARLVAENSNERTQIHISHATLVNCNRFTRDLELFLAPMSFDLRRASRQLISFIDLTLQSFNSGQDIAADERLMLRVLATVMLPIMPTEAENILNALEEESRVWMSDWANARTNARSKSI